MQRKLASGKREKLVKFLVTICPFWFLRFSLYGPIFSTLHLKSLCWNLRLYSCLILKEIMTGQSIIMTGNQFIRSLLAMMQSFDFFLFQQNYLFYYSPCISLLLKYILILFNFFSSFTFCNLPIFKVWLPQDRKWQLLLRVRSAAEHNKNH